MINNNPEMTCTQKPVHIMGYSFLSGVIGRSGATPRRRKSRTAFALTSIVIPIAWRVRMDQYPNREGVSRIHTLREVSSMVRRNTGIANSLSLTALTYRVVV